MKIMSCILPAALAGLMTLPAISVQAEDIFYGVQMEEFEYRAGDNGEDLFVWDGDAFAGTDEFKLRWEGSGEYDLNGDVMEALSNQVSLQIPVSDFWDIKAGVRADTPEGEDRFYGAVGLMGLAPHWIEVDADLYLSEKGDVSASLDMEYELLLTNYLILTPSAEITGAFSSDEEIGSGSGINSAELGLRLSYDIWDRTLSPYIGVAYERKFGQTADFAKEEGEETSSWFLVIGAKLLFWPFACKNAEAHKRFRFPPVSHVSNIMKSIYMIILGILFLGLPEKSAFADDPSLYQSAEIMDAVLTPAERGDTSLLKIRIRNERVDALTIMGVSGERHLQSIIIARLGERGYAALDSLYLPQEENLDIGSAHILIYLRKIIRPIHVGETIKLQLVLTRGELPFTAHVDGERIEEKPFTR